MTDLIRAYPCRDCPQVRTENGYVECGSPRATCSADEAVDRLEELADMFAGQVKDAHLSHGNLCLRREWSSRLADAFADMLADQSAELDRDEFLRRAIPLMERKPEGKP
jgi:hypothetical protein